MKILFVVLALFFVPSFVYAGTAVGTANPIIGYTVMNGQNVQAITANSLNIPNTSNAFGALHSALLGSPSVTTQNTGTITPNNPSGYTPLLNNAGAATLSASESISVSPPVGSTPSASQISAAVALAGAAGLATGVLGHDVPLGSGSGSLAANLALPALGFVAAAGGAAGMVLGSPALLAGSAAAGVGMAGYQLFQALKGQGVTVAPDGSSSISSSGFSSYQNGITGGGPWSTPALACAAITGGPYSGAVLTGSMTCHFYHAYAGSWFDQIISGVGSPVVSSVPATDKALADAVIAAMASNASIALDAANLAIKNGVDIQKAIRDSGAQANTNALHLESAFSKLSESIDSVGNTQSELARTVLNVPSFPACAYGDPTAIANRGTCAPKIDEQTVPLVNNAPQKVTTTPQEPAMKLAVSQATPFALQTPQSQQAKSDLCVDHPDALACSNDASLTDVPLAPLTTKNLAVSLKPVSVSGLASCPAPITIGGGKIFVFDGICTWAAMFKPLLLAFAWLTAGAVVFRGRPYA